MLVSGDLDKKDPPSGQRGTKPKLSPSCPRLKSGKPGQGGGDLNEPWNSAPGKRLAPPKVNKEVMDAGDRIDISGAMGNGCLLARSYWRLPWVPMAVFWRCKGQGGQTSPLLPRRRTTAGTAWQKKGDFKYTPKNTTDSYHQQLCHLAVVLLTVILSIAILVPGFLLN
jgi:hypothetical protein